MKNFKQLGNILFWVAFVIYMYFHLQDRVAVRKRIQARQDAKAAASQ